MERKALFLLAFIVTATMLFSCAPDIPDEPTTWVSPLSPISSSSPIETEIESTNEPDFSLDEPLLEGDTQVSGTGPYDLPITIVDVTLMGEVLGRGTVGSEGHFEIEVEPPLIANHRIGIMIDEDAIDEYTEELLRRLDDGTGDDAITLPRIGKIYDAATVRSSEP